MKLQSFITEQTVDALDISKFVEGLDKKYQKSVKTFLARFKSFKPVSTDVREEEMYIRVSNGLVDFDFEFYRESGINEEYPVVGLAAMINHKYVFNSENIQEHEYHLIALVQVFSRELAFDRENSLFKNTDHLINVAEKFTEWYFDLSAKYGKVKLTKTTFNPLDNSFGNSWRWIPVTGFFFADNDKIDSDVI